MINFEIIFTDLDKCDDLCFFHITFFHIPIFQLVFPNLIFSEKRQDILDLMPSSRIERYTYKFIFVES